MAVEVACPFECGYKKSAPSGNEYAIQLHIEEVGKLVGKGVETAHVEVTWLSETPKAYPFRLRRWLTTHQHHTESSPFNIINSAPGPSSSHISTTASADALSESEWTKCTRPGCGEFMQLADIQEHLDLHEAIEASEDDAGNGKRQPPQRYTSNGRSRSPSNGGLEPSKSEQRNRWEGRSNGSSQRSKASQSSAGGSNRSLLDYFSGSSNHGRPPLPPRPPRRIEQPRQPGRLGTKELGPHAFEKTMPAEVRRRLLNDALPRHLNRVGRDGRLVKETYIENETPALIPVLADLCARTRSTEASYFCHPSTRHVHKIRCEGNFCGYWNIQMLSSFLADNSRNNGLLPNVLQIQDKIEQAWDNGICTYSRIETDGIRGSRKWIGTHDALAYFTQVGVNTQALSFKDEDEEQPAILSLLDHLEAYFMSGLESAKTNGTSSITDLPPVYFQRAGHSMTIVGLERKKDGHRNLIIFDPSFGTTKAMDQVLDGRRTNAEPHMLLKPYRRSDESLSRWKEFEILIPQPKSGQASR